MSEKIEQRCIECESTVAALRRELSDSKQKLESIDKDTQSRLTTLRERADTDREKLKTMVTSLEATIEEHKATNQQIEQRYTTAIKNQNDTAAQIERVRKMYEESTEKQRLTFEGATKERANTIVELQHKYEAQLGVLSALNTASADKHSQCEVDVSLCGAKNATTIAEVQLLQQERNNLTKQLETQTGTIVATQQQLTALRTKYEMLVIDNHAQAIASAASTTHGD
jgi:chromosome segregation ATPase